jgi:hypothetical protein
VSYNLAGDAAHHIGYEQRPEAIYYTGTVDGSLPARRSVHFAYEERPDSITHYVNGLELQSRYRLHTITCSRSSRPCSYQR